MMRLELALIGMVLIGAAAPAFAQSEVMIDTGTVRLSVPGCGETDECYIPGMATAAVGDRVIMTNNDEFLKHTFTSGTDSIRDGVFDSGTLAFEEIVTFEWVPEEAGEYPYFCNFHPWMTGIITVEESEPAGAMAEGGVVDVQLSHDSSTISLYFLDKVTGDLQEHIDYYIYIAKDGEGVYGPTDRTHTDSGADRMEVDFDRGDGQYTVEVRIDGVLFSVIPEEIAVFDIMVEAISDEPAGDDVIEVQITQEGTGAALGFYSRETGMLQEHIDYYIHVTRDGEDVYGPTERTHTDSGSAEIPAEFAQAGEYAVNVRFDGVLFEDVPEQSASFAISGGGQPDGYQEATRDQSKLDVGLGYDEAGIDVDFDSKETGRHQPHVDYYVHVTKDGKSVFGPTPRSHIDPGTGEFAVDFEQDGVYTVNVRVDGIFFVIVPDEIATFEIVIGEPDESAKEPQEGGGCLIATAAYGTELAPQVQQLRELRESVVMSTESGAAFMSGFNDFYYSFSPVIADLERENPAFRDLVRISITPLVSSLSLLNHVDIDTEAEMIGYGVSLILLNLAMYAGVPALGIVMLARRRKI